MKYFLLALMLLGAVVTVRGATPEAVATPKTAARTSRGVRFSDVQLKTGVRLRYAEQGNSKGQPIILLHGYCDSWFSYSRILPLMTRSTTSTCRISAGMATPIGRQAAFTVRRLSASLCPNGATSYSPGFPGFGGYPGKEEDLNPQPQRGCVCFVDSGMGAVATALRLSFNLQLSQGSRQSATALGFTYVAPLGHQQKGCILAALYFFLAFFALDAFVFRGRPGFLASMFDRSAFLIR